MPAIRSAAILLFAAPATGYNSAQCRNSILRASQPSHARATAPTLSDSFMFTALQQPNGDDGSVTVPALVAPLSSPLWVGETREIVPTPAEYKLLASLNHSDTFLHLGASQGTGTGFKLASAGAVGCEAQLLSLSLSAATVRGVGRIKVAVSVTERPWRVVKGRRILEKRFDDSSRVQALRDIRSRAQECWDAASGCSQRIQAARFNARLQKLGGAASAALLAIPMEDQLALRKAASGADDSDLVGRPSSIFSRPPSLEELLESGVSLSEEMDAASAAIAEMAMAEADASPEDVEWSALCVQSHVALRLASGGDEGEHARAMKGEEGAVAEDGAPLPPPIVARWEKAADLLANKRAMLQAVESMTAAMAPPSEEDDSSAGRG